MRFQTLNRKAHYWAAAVIAVPVLIMIATGLLLQVKKQFSWIQPPEQRGTGIEPAVSFAKVLEACRAEPKAEVRSWADISRVDIIESIHDGSWFHQWAKLGVFLPAALILLLLWLTGMYLFCLPIMARRRRQLSAMPVSNR